MGGGQQSFGTLKGIIAAIIVALAAGGSSPWWWDKLFPRHPSPTQQKPIPAHHEPTPTIGSTPIMDRPPRVMGPLEYGMAYLQADLYSKPSASAEECATRCKNDARCKAMTYIKSQRLCWIKNAVPAAASSPDMISAVKQSAIAVMGPLEYGRAYLQADLYSKPSASAEECATRCKNDAQCKAMTYIKSQSLCWIKNAVPAAASSPDMISAVKQTP